MKCQDCGYNAVSGEFDNGEPKDRCPSCGALYDKPATRTVSSPPENRMITRAPFNRKQRRGIKR